MPLLSAGVVLVRTTNPEPAFLLVHPGGPFWARRDDGAWSIPKGEYSAGEEPVAAAEREFEEELGVACPGGPRYPLGDVKQKAGKVVSAWCVVGDVDATNVTSNEFEIEWPPRSGRMQRFPEIDRAGWFGLAEARVKILTAQAPLLDRAVAALDAAGILPR